MPVSPTEKQCPECKVLFICQSDDIRNCQCNNISLTEESIPFPTQKAMLVEGLHYYKENDYWVFTELYHTLRGTCCQSGCRHCVYGFTKTNVNK